MWVFEEPKTFSKLWVKNYAILVTNTLNFNINRRTSPNAVYIDRDNSAETIRTESRSFRNDISYSLSIYFSLMKLNSNQPVFVRVVQKLNQACTEKVLVQNEANINGRQGGKKQVGERESTSQLPNSLSTSLLLISRYPSAYTTPSPFLIPNLVPM
jgi:hypothetical protein